jgi:hypothetical protein
MQERILLHKLMQQDVHRAVSSNIVVNAQPATPSAPTAVTAQPTCAQQQVVSRLQVIAHPIPIHLPKW